MAAEAPLPADVSSADAERIYRSLRRIRRVEEEIARIYPTDKIKSPVHLSIGQEAVSVGVIDTLADSDVVAGSYRCHGAYIAKGGDLKAMMAELFGKSTGCAGGKGGSMHLVDMKQKIVGASAVVGTYIPVALGFALASKRRRERHVVAVFFGDGATEEGVFYESLNFAALHKLPVLFVCENNFYAIHTPLAKRWANTDLCARVETFGIPARRVANGDVFAIRAHATDAVAKMRSGHGPAFLECLTYRWREHVGPGEDYDAGYRSRDELRIWQERDQVARTGALLSSSVRAKIDHDIEAEIAAAIAFAEQSPEPEQEELYRDVFAN